MDGFQTILAIFIIIAFHLLVIHFLYTIYATFKGAVFLPTPKKAVKQVLELGRPVAGDTVMDLGSGDGRMLIACASSGAECIGIEINLLLVFFSRLRIFLTASKNTKVRCQNFWNVDLSEVDLLVIFLVPIKMARLKDKIKNEMKPESRVVSYRYTFPDWPWQEKKDKVYLYIV